MGSDTISPFAKLHSAKLDTSLTRSTRAPEEQTPENPRQPSLQPQQLARANARTPEPSKGKRITTRESFDIYEDQMASLREISYLEKREGKLGSMSAMVREALDTYLAKQPLTSNPHGRTPER